MTRDRWQQIKWLFDEALKREPSVRGAFVAEQSGGDSELRREVESLLAALGKDADRFERPAVELTTGLLPEDDAEAMIGQHVGPYLLLRVVGWGGMGTVYEAVRSDREFRKRVAIKLIRRGMDSHLVVRRFRHERQILAGLEHTNIAGLLDGGVSADGRPYFAMEYVEGEAIDVYCRSLNLPVRKRLELFLDVCEAVQYAHRNLVVHRDLKPRNILVSESGDVKLLDFGVAKLLDHGDEDGTALLTRAGDQLLTPEYAAPEQVRGESITTASDVYSLGVILYELLAGQCPYRLERRTLQEIVRTITEEEPVRPSVAVTVANADSKAAGVAAHLRRQLAGDLDSIVLMAIRKEPERRYASVEQFGEDVRRYLEGRPVLAQADTAMYHARKFIRRHSLGVAAAALVLVTMAGSVMMTMSQAHRADEARMRAEAHYEDLRALSNVLLFDIHDEIAELPGATAARNLLLREGIEYLDLLSRQSDGDPALERELAAAYIRLGRIQGSPTGANLGDLAGARESHLRALSIADRLVAADARDSEAKRTGALAHEKLASVESWSGNLRGGVEHAREALKRWQDLADVGPGSRALLPVAISRINLGDLLGHPSFPNLADRAGAMAEYRHALKILEALPSADAEQGRQDWTTRRYIGVVHERMGAMHLFDQSYDDALASFDQSFSIRQALAAENPANMDALRDVGIAHEKICSVHLARSDPEAALAYCRQALDVYRQLRATDPKDTQSLSTLATGHRWLYRALAARGDLDAALDALERSTELFREQLDTGAASVRARRDYARNLLDLSVLHARLSDEVEGPAAGREEHRRRSASYYEGGRQALQALRAEGTALAVDDDLLKAVQATLELPRAPAGAAESASDGTAH